MSLCQSIPGRKQDKEVPTGMSPPRRTTETMLPSRNTHSHVLIVHALGPLTEQGALAQVTQTVGIDGETCQNKNNAKMRTLGLAPLHRALGEKGLLLSSILKGGLGGKGRCQAGTEDPGHSSWATLEHVASYNVSPLSYVPTGGILNPPDGHLGGPTLP